MPNRSEPASTALRGVPAPVVAFTRRFYLVVLLAAFVAQLPMLTTALLLLVTANLIFGRRANPLGYFAALALKKRLPHTEYEDERIIRFNTGIIAVLLVAAQIAFAFGFPVAAWSFVGAIVAACAAALSGYCVGCVVYYKFKLYKYRFFGQ